MWLMRHTLGYIGREGMNTKKILCTCVFMYKLQTPRHAKPTASTGHTNGQHRGQ